MANTMSYTGLPAFVVAWDFMRIQGQGAACGAPTS